MLSAPQMNTVIADTCFMKLTKKMSVFPYYVYNFNCYFCRVFNDIQPSFSQVVTFTIFVEVEIYNKVVKLGPGDAVLVSTFN